MIIPTRSLQVSSLSAPLFYLLPEKLQCCNIVVYFALFILFLVFYSCKLGKKLKIKNITLKPSPTFLLYHQIKKEENSIIYIELL